MALSADDWVQIANLLSRYCQTNDFGDAEGWSRVFTEDGLFEESFSDKGVVTRLRGRKAIKEFALQIPGMIPHVKYARHWITNAIIEGDGDRATATCFVKFINTIDGGSAIVTGIYKDEIRKVNGEWLFSYRQAILDQTEEEASAAMKRLALRAKETGREYRLDVGAFAGGDR